MAQPHLGNRKLYSTRLPTDVAAAFEAEASSATTSYSRMLADAIADRYGLQRPSERHDQAPAARQPRSQPHRRSGNGDTLRIAGPADGVGSAKSRPNTDTSFEGCGIRLSFGGLSASLWFGPLARPRGWPDGC